MKYKVLKTIVVPVVGKVAKPGETVELEESAAKELLRRGRVKPDVTAEAPKEPETGKDAGKTDKPAKADKTGDDKDK